MRFALAAIAGLGLGALSGQFLFGGSTWNLIPWAVGAIVLGCLIRSRKAVAAAAALYGYLLVFAFLFVANAGEVSAIQKLLFAAGLGLVGPVCAIPIALLANVLYRRIRKPPEKSLME